MTEIEASGSTKHYENVKTDPNECTTIIYTSGSSGFPKGAMISERAYRSTFEKWCTPYCAETVYFCYEPLAWVSGRDAVIRTFFSGGRIGFSTGDVSRLMEDLALVRPTTFSSTPAVWNKIYAEFKTALSLSTANISSEAIVIEENRLLEQFAKLIPIRCKTIIIGGAMISPVVFDFVKRCFKRCRIHESYGITECGSVAFNKIVTDKLQFHLVSVPEMGYTIDDEPFPRGEILIKSSEMFSGYVNNPEETRAALTDDGFFRSGDIVELRISENGELSVHVIDRKKNFFKLSQGQYVSPEFLQSIYIQSPFIEQIYIHGELLADSISAVVVPNREYALAFMSEQRLKNFDTNNPDPQFYEAILKDLHSIAEKHSLRKHEIPSRLIIDFEPFTPENGLLTSTMKPCRPKLAAYYGSRLKQSNNFEQQLKSIIETTTNQLLSIDKENNFFIPNGGDSLQAVRLSRKIENDLGVSVPISILLQPNMTFQQLVNVIRNPSQISSISNSILQRLLTDSNLASDIKIDKLENVYEPPTAIFITGTTGFVGGFLLAELLSIYPSTCKFICLVRSKSLTNLLSRIQQNMMFHKIWKDGFQRQIVPLEGDLDKIHFGLELSTYENLANEIDLIFHCGASVNFVSPYDKLFSSNVFGTEQIIRLATQSTRLIPVHYISTLSVFSSNINQEVSIDEISPNGLTNGYAQSKWVAEKLIAKASSLGLPVVIYRLGSIHASTETGACNRHDLYTFLFTAIMKLNSYPKTITDAYLQGLPVNFTAKTIAYLSRMEPNIFGKVYHVLDPNSKIPIENIIKAICSCGVQLYSIPFDDWRMELKTLNNNNGSLWPVEAFLNEDIFNQCYRISAAQFCEAVSALKFPPIDDLYLSKWMNFILENIVSQ